MGNRLLYRLVPDALEVLGGISRTTVYAEIKAGRLKVVKIGRSTFVTAEELERYVGTLAGDRVA